MASTSGCSHQLKDLRLCNTSCTMCDSSEKSDVGTTTPTSEVDHATPATCYFSVVEEQIEQSKAHWSTLVDHSDYMDEEEVNFEVSNMQEFQALQGHHSTWGCFFQNFTGDAISTGYHHGDYGELVVGKKFAEGGQAELYEAQIKWFDPNELEIDWQYGCKYVLKVFKKGTLLKHVKSQLPQGLLRFHADALENTMSRTPKVLPQHTSQVYGGILLKDGRFGFLMVKFDFDLRTFIERNMKLRRGEYCGPFSKEEGEVIMYQVALGVEWLHNGDIVHRDLKASNVLVYKNEGRWPGFGCYVADYECSIGVVGTNFFRAPEILQACKDAKVNERPEVFLRTADVYSYGMTCYEILRGKLPFENHPLKYRCSILNDLVINQHLCPDVPKYVEDWTRELLGGCWQFDPARRPRIEEILNVLSTNSSEVRRFESWLKENFDKTFGS